MRPESKQTYQSFLKYFYAYRFFNDFAFIYAVYILLFKMNGLSVFEISLLLALWCGFVILFEVPTGALADKWNRKYMLSLGMLSKAIGFGIWFFADDFWLFALGFLFWGIQEAFCSGTQEALLFDNLKDFGKEDAYERIAGQGYFYSKIAAAISVFLGGFLASISFHVVILLSSASMVAALLPTLFFRDVRFDQSSQQKKKYFHAIKDAFKESAKDIIIKRLFLYTAVVLAVIGVLDEYEQLFFHWVGLPIAFFGVFIVMRMGLEAVGSKVAYRLQKYFKNSKNIYLFAMLSGILLIAAITMKSIFMLPVFALVFLFGSVGEVLVEAGLQRQIQSDQRATILSINSLLLNLSAIFLAVGFGILSKIGDLTWGFFAFGVLVILFSVISMVFKRSEW